MYIDAFHFQPFESRAHEPPVVGLRCPYDADLVTDLKAFLAQQKPACVDRARGVRAAGGWLGECRVWFVEPPAWPAVRRGLEGYGHCVTWRVRPDDVPHYGDGVDEVRFAAPATVPTAPPEPAGSPPERACRQCSAALHRRWVTVIYSIVATTEPVIAGFCDLRCLHVWLGDWAERLHGAAVTVAPSRVPAEVA